MVTTKVMVTVHLSPAQTQLLRFFADQATPPRPDAKTYAALSSQGLIEHDDETSTYRITELGRQTVTALERDENLTK